MFVVFLNVIKKNCYRVWSSFFEIKLCLYIGRMNLSFHRNSNSSVITDLSPLNLRKRNFLSLWITNRPPFSLLNERSHNQILYVIHIEFHLQRPLSNNPEHSLRSTFENTIPYSIRPSRSYLALFTSPDRSVLCIGPLYVGVVGI